MARFGVLKEILLKNWGLKALALVFSTALWFFVAGEKISEVGMLVPLAVKGAPEGMAVISELPQTVEIRVSGSKTFINTLSPSDIKAELHLSGWKEGVGAYPILRGNITVPKGIEVVKIKPSSIEVRLEKLEKGSLPVNVKLKGVLPRGYRVKGVSVEPAVVTVTGRKKDMGGLRSVATSPVDITGMTKNGSVSVPLDIPGKDLIVVKPSTVVVKVRIEKHG